MTTYGPKYLGSKFRMLDPVCSTICKHAPETALDVFSGTTRVAQELRSRGVRVTTSDIATYTRVFSKTWVSGIHDMRVVEYYASLLDRLEPVDGWFARTYCDAPAAEGGGVVRFMSRENGMRVDAIRAEIKALEATGKITADEACALTTTLILAMDKVDNTMGIQQSYFQTFIDRTFKRLAMQVYSPPIGPVGTHVQGDVLDIALPAADIAYIDPPYTAANYQTHYHIWETIARGDEPDVVLKTNRRADRAGGKVRNPWGSRKTAADCMRRLLDRLDVTRVVVSYGGSSVIAIEELLELISANHDIESHTTLELGENVMSNVGTGARRGVSTPRRVEHIIVACSRG